MTWEYVWFVGYGHAYEAGHVYHKPADRKYGTACGIVLERDGRETHNVDGFARSRADLLGRPCKRCYPEAA